MPIRFSTEAANADVLGEDADTSGAPKGTSEAVGADGTTRRHFSRSTPRGSSSSDAPTGEAKPGKDINAPGFVKDKDSSKP
jgi:hypothetical protein